MGTPPKAELIDATRKSLLVQTPKGEWTKPLPSFIQVLIAGITVARITTDDLNHPPCKRGRVFP